MAVYRTPPTCPFCGEIIATAQYKDQSKTPLMLRTIGDTFIGWKYKEHSCDAMKTFQKKISEDVKNNPKLQETLDKINKTNKSFLNRKK
jgi:hypothetical protein